MLDRIAAAFPDACVVASVHRMSLLSHFDQMVVWKPGACATPGRARQPQLRAQAGSTPSPQDLKSLEFQKKFDTKMNQ